MPPSSANTRQIVVSEAIAQRIEALRDVLADKAGRKISLGETVSRAVESLEDCHTRGAWLSPAESAPLNIERIKRVVVEIVDAVLRDAAPELGFRGIGWDDANGLAVAVFHDDQAPVAVPIGPIPDRSEAPLN